MLIAVQLNGISRPGGPKVTMIRMTKFMLMVFGALSGPALAGQIQDTKVAAREAGERGDFVTEARLMHSLADEGDAEAQAALARMYVAGRGVLKDNIAAIAWFQKAAAQGYPYGQMNLAYMFSMGRGVPVDYVQAYLWFHQAAVGFETGIIRDRVSRDEAKRMRDDVSKYLTPDQLAEAQRLVRDWGLKERSRAP